MWCFEVGPVGGGEIMKVETLMNEISAPESFLPSAAMWGHNKTAIYELRSEPSPDSTCVSILTLDFQASSSAGGTQLVFAVPPAQSDPAAARTEPNFLPHLRVKSYL